MTTRIISEPTGTIDPDEIFIVQFAHRGFFGIKWISLEWFKSYERAKEFERNLNENEAPFSLESRRQIAMDMARKEIEKAGGAS